MFPMAAVSDAASFYWCFALVATLLGIALALLDDSKRPTNAGFSPASHVADCADSAEMLISGLFDDAPGLGLLEPLWRLFTPEGALWTLLTGWSPRDSKESLGFSGLISAIYSLFHAVVVFLFSSVLRICKVFSRRGKKAKASGQGPSSLTHEKIALTLGQELAAYLAYTYLFALGVVREYLVRFLAVVWRDEVSRRYVTRERWSTGWVDFYLQHMYKLYVDCFNRPIASAPDALIDVVVRTRPGGPLFSPLNDFTITKEVKTCVNLASYNYLGFGGVDEFCTPVAKAAVQDFGWSTCAPRTEGGTLQIHRDLEQEVAEYLGKEDALVLGMGFATNSTIIPALFEVGSGAGILVLSDELNHRSIVEGVRLSGATIRAFGHNDMEKLESELKRAVTDGQPKKPDAPTKPWRKIFVVVEGIYSMEGDFCRLREVVTLKNRYGAYLYLDEAHSIGAVGATGRGVTELQGVPTSEVDIMMGTFTKSFGSAGGYVASSKEVIAALRRNAPGSVFAQAMAAPCAAQALIALRVISGKVGGSTGKEKLARIRENSNFFRRELEQRGFKVIGDEDSPIIPVMLHHPAWLGAFSRLLLARGVAVVVVGNPAVPLLYERVRFCISAAHTREQLLKALDEVTIVGSHLGMLFDKDLDAAVVKSRAARSAEYQRWIRTAPLERRSGKATAPAAAGFVPEPLAPASKGCLSALLEQSSVTPVKAKRPSCDLRQMDPLGLTLRPLGAAQEATFAAMKRYGFGACGPRGFYGGTLPHLQLETAIAKFLGHEAAILYSAGVLTTSSVLSSLIQPGDHVIVDTEVNLGIRTGLRLCKAEVTWVAHGDVASWLASVKNLTEEKPGAKAPQRRTFLVVEAICQRTGSIAPLQELLAMKKQYGALIILDETLSFGGLGAKGRGLCESIGVAPTEVDAVIGSLEHAIAAVGGFCAGRRGLVDHQRLAGSGYCYSAASPPSSASAATAVIEALDGPELTGRRETCRERAKELNKALRGIAEQDKRIQALSSPESFMQFLRWCGPEANAAASLMALQKGVGAFVPQVCAPAEISADAAFSERLQAPKPKTSDVFGLRFCVSSELTSQDIASLAAHLQTALASL